MNFHEPPVLPRGFLCASRNVGIRNETKDLALFVSDVDAAAAAIFTRNHFPGAPIILGRQVIRGGKLRAIFANSKCSNVATGAQGMENARRMAAAAASEVGTTPDRVLISSTGVIGVQLPIEKIEAGVRGMAAALQANPLVGAEGIMTTDRHPKAVSIDAGNATISIVAKGAGMIQPNMATMLAYIFTDAAFDAPALDKLLRKAAAVSFNALSIDTDTSTSDTCAILANGHAGKVPEQIFLESLTHAAIRMSEMLARDGEGATKLIRAFVRGAASDADARTIARSIINSPLIKTMAHGADPNVGRILMAIGKCFDCNVQPDTTNAMINGYQVIAGGERTNFDEDTVRKALRTDTVDIEVDLSIAHGRATAYGCDLTRGYIEENAAYYST